MKRQEIIETCVAVAVVSAYFLLAPFAPASTIPIEQYRAVLVVDDLLIALALMVVSSLITAALTPKPKPPQPGKADKPEILEGKAPLMIYGAVWVKDPFMASWVQIDPAEPIKSKGGK